MTHSSLIQLLTAPGRYCNVISACSLTILANKFTAGVSGAIGVR